MVVTKHVEVLFAKFSNDNQHPVQYSWNGEYAALDKMYGYTSDAQGIHNALLDEPTPDADNAQFMLVSCSAFMSYLKAKSSKSA